MKFVKTMNKEVQITISRSNEVIRHTIHGDTNDKKSADMHLYDLEGNEVINYNKSLGRLLDKVIDNNNVVCEYETATVKDGKINRSANTSIIMTETHLPLSVFKKVYATTWCLTEDTLRRYNKSLDLSLERLADVCERYALRSEGDLTKKGASSFRDLCGAFDSVINYIADETAYKLTSDDFTKKELKLLASEITSKEKKLYTSKGIYTEGANGSRIFDICLVAYARKWNGLNLLDFETVEA